MRNELAARYPVRILHILDHSLPLHSGYTFRTLSILQEQRRLGWETTHLTGPKQGSGVELDETVDGWHFLRTPHDGKGLRGLPGLAELAMMGSLTRRLEDVAKRISETISRIDEHLRVAFHGDGKGGMTLTIVAP